MGNNIMPKTNHKRILLSKKKKNRKQNSLKKNKIQFQKKTVLKKRRQFTRKSKFTIPVSKRKTSCRRKRTNRYRKQGGMRKLMRKLSLSSSSLSENANKSADNGDDLKK